MRRGAADSGSGLSCIQLRVIMRFINFDTDAFLRDYWQRKPLLIKNPWETWRNPLEPDDLAGLACEDDVESRLITKAHGTWSVEHGPIPEERFNTLGKVPWTLLVQAVDHTVPDVAALIEPFRFIPNWRIDDVMVSYATDGGGVGPHFDQYDVFLIQGLGQRRWQVGAHGEGKCTPLTPLLPHDDLRLLAHFDPVDEWVLDPGDILYVPPCVAHNGVAVGEDCMTFSIGFRAPARSALIAHYCDHLLAELDDDDRYADPNMQAQSQQAGQNPGEISASALAHLHAMITDKLGDRDSFARWFGQYNSTPKYADQDWTPDASVTNHHLRADLAGGRPLWRNPASRFSFVRQATGGVLLFVDGECIECGRDVAAVAEQLCMQSRIAAGSELIQSDAAMSLLVTLFNQGSLIFEESD